LSYKQIRKVEIAMEYFSIVSNQILLFVIYAVIGIVCVKTNVLDRRGLLTLSKLVARVCLSCLIFVNMIKAVRENDVSGYLSVLVVAVFFFALLYVLGIVIANICHLEGEKRNLFRAGTMFSNSAFMGIPIIEAVFGSVGILMVALYTIVGDIILWTWGAGLTLPPDREEKRTLGSIVRKIMSPCFVALLLGLLVGFSPLNLPKDLIGAISKVGACASPLAMIYIGGILCFVDLKHGLFRKEFILLVIVKMCILPVLLERLLFNVPFVGREVAFFIGLMSALPMMVTVSLIAESNGSDSTYTAALVILTTALSVFTLPLVCLFM